MNISLWQYPSDLCTGKMEMSKDIEDEGRNNFAEGDEEKEARTRGSGMRIKGGFITNPVNYIEMPG